MAWYDQPGTTNISGAAFGNPTRAEVAAARPAPPARLPAPDTGPSRTFGFRSGATQPGGVAEQHLAAATAAGEKLGEPTSFRGGAGAPAAVPIMRGTRTTYEIPAATPEGGGFVAQPGTGQEFASPMRAGQEYNRGQGAVATEANDRRRLTNPNVAAQFGGFRPEGMTKEEVIAKSRVESAAAANPAKTPYYEGQGKRATAEAGAIEAKLKQAEGQQHVDKFHEWLQQSPYATFSDGKLQFKSKDEHMERDRIASEAAAKEAGNWKTGQQHFEDRQDIRRWLTTQPLPSGFDANVYLNELAVQPQLWQKLVTKAKQLPPATARQPWYRFGPPAGGAETITPDTGFVAP